MCDPFWPMTLPPEHSSRPAVQTLRWFCRPIEFLGSCRSRYGETFGIRFFRSQTPMYLTSDPAAIKVIYSNNENPRPPGRSAGLEPVMGPRSILLLEGSEHLARRKVMLPPFHGERMRAYESVIEEVVGGEIDSWPTGQEFRIHPRMQNVTLEVILRAVFGVTDETRLSRLREEFRLLLRQKLIGIASKRLGRWGPWRRFEGTRQRVNDLIYDEIAERRAAPDLENREDILSMLVPARFEDGSEMSDSELRDQLVTMLLAGHETTATSLAWTFDLLLRNPSALERLRSEIVEDGDEYLRAVILESLRLRPVVPTAGRRLAEEIEVDGYTLPPGSDISPAIYLTHTRPDLYPEPVRFKPERFLDGEPETYSWIPFGGGVHRCLGASFGEFEMRIVLREVLARCRLQAASDRAERMKRRTFTFSPRHGTPVLVEHKADAPQRVPPESAAV
jgi:cytochrome P450